MSQNFQFPNNQGGAPNQGPQGYGYGPPPGPSNSTGGGSSSGTALKIILIVVGVFALLGVLGCGVMVMLLIPAVGAARQAASRVQDQNSLKMIGLAFHNYESTYKRLPAPTIVNVEKKPVFAWSVSLLPFLEEYDLYNKINWMNMQPWDDPVNGGLFQQAAPQVLQCVRANLPLGSNECNVFIISAPQNVPGQNPIFVEGSYGRFAGVVDGLSNTILAIQLPKYSVPWASPTTLTVDEAYQLIQNEDKYVNVVMGDGFVTAIPTTIDKPTFQAMVTRDGGEVIQIPEYVP